MKIIENNIHIRTAHSKLVGFWITEMGGINEVYHLWEFGKSRHPQDGPRYVVHVHVLNSVTSESLSLSLTHTHTHTHNTDNYQHHADVRKALILDDNWNKCLSKIRPMFISQVSCAY